MMKNEFPKISILIPTYNRVHYLREALASALTQDYPHLEVVISDNASTDGTEEYIRGLSDPRIRYYRNSRNLGSGANYEKLLYEYAAGQYAKYLTDDDYLIDNGHLSRAMGIIARYNIKTVFSAAVSRFENERTGTNLSLELDEVVPRQWWLANMGRTRKGLSYFPSIGIGTVFEVEKAKQLGAFHGQCYGDYIFGIQCILSEERTGYIRMPSYVERRHAGQDGRTSYRHAFEGARSFARMCDFGRQIGLDENVMLDFNRRLLRFVARGFMVQNWAAENGKSITSFRRFLKDMQKLDEKLPMVLMRDPQVLMRFFLCGTRMYSWCRKLNYFVIGDRKERQVS
jgi:glycosyltransferase involved in cell wall biosynthesis